MPVIRHYDSVSIREMEAGVSTLVHRDGPPKGVSVRNGKGFCCWRLATSGQSLNFKCSFVVFDIYFLLESLAWDTPSRTPG